ncbi:hypothetical protein PR048_010945 [Dryococelus australis]|uniref:Uncharacterized protein n=1 Tax=Dryococelus australis TaxID=614101 RepID=A0ABQ9HK85_9NEOP|nr:hypothetical protein PR048_010945 [Dryococelus australis]
MELLEGRPDYDCLKGFVQTLLIISHGNAALERGFSINKEIIVENQKERQIFDAVTAKGGIANMEVSKLMIHSVRNAHSRYNEALQEQKMMTEAKEREHAAGRKNEQIITVLLDTLQINIDP